MTEAKIVSVNTQEVEFIIPSSRDGCHSVKYNRTLDTWSCTCEWYGFRGGYCRHMKLAKKLFSELNKDIQKSEQTTKQMRWEEQARQGVE